MATKPPRNRSRTPLQPKTPGERRPQSRRPADAANGAKPHRATVALPRALYERVVGFQRGAPARPTFNAVVVAALEDFLAERESAVLR
jgi:hypothetical protein